MKKKKAQPASAPVSKAPSMDLWTMGLWCVIVHQRTVFGPFLTEQEARSWAAAQVLSYNWPSPSGEVHFGALTIMKIAPPTGGVR